MLAAALAEGGAYSFMTLRSFSEDLGSLYRDGREITGKLFLEYFLDEWSWVLSAALVRMDRAISPCRVAMPLTIAFRDTAGLRKVAAAGIKLLFFLILCSSYWREWAVAVP
ncbi:MAG: hypothetical protein ACP5MM_04195 [Acidithiobacillus sp.]|uniref:hypothetical protein n=1 Tax=Acidithiobacillus sp. TaxID=1872118 RepID=UPI003D046399